MAFSLPLGAQVAYMNIMLENGEIIEYAVDDVKEISFSVDDNCITDGVHEWVDLGLTSGTLWATYNVGASTPDGYGYYYAWGEIDKKNSYYWPTYKFSNSDGTSFTKYNTVGSFGRVDNLTELTADDDVALHEWGKEWAIPTASQIKELMDECNWEWTYYDGSMGYLVRSKKNDRYIFLPAAGNVYEKQISYTNMDGHYWTKSLSTEWAPQCALILNFNSRRYEITDSSRFMGGSVRPVKMK